MKQQLLYSLLFLVGSTTLFYSQTNENPTYDWVWATNGGGGKNIEDNDSMWIHYYLNREIYFEHVVDVKVDADNNSYVLAIIGQMSTEFAGEPVETYNYEGSPMSASDILLTSLDCEGQVRWVRVIGGHLSDWAYSLGLDANGGVYVGAIIYNSGSHVADGTPNYLLDRKPVYFDENTHMPYVNAENDADRIIPHEGFKSLALTKYNTIDGSLAWVQFPEGLIAEVAEETGYLGQGLTNLTYSANKVVVEPDGTSHWLVAFRPGTHLNGTLTVPGGHDFSGYNEFYVLVYKADGTIKRFFKVPLTTNADNNTVYGGGGIIRKQEDHNFWYDPVKQHYYLGGYWWSLNNGFPNPSFDGEVFRDGGYLVAFDPSGNELWRMVTDENAEAKVLDVKTDTEGGVYITGIVWTKSKSNGKLEYYDGYFGDFEVLGTGGRPYIMKLNPEDGAVVWGTLGEQIPNEPGREDNGTSVGERLSFSDHEVVLAMGLGPCKWGAFEPGISVGEYYNPFLVRFGKADGAPQGMYRINAGKTTPSKLTAVAVDNDGNFIVGGFHSSPMFYDHPTMPMLYQIGGHVDFFVAKLAAGACGVPVLHTESQQTLKPILFPNPTTDKVYWNADIDWLYHVVYDITGKVVQQGALYSSEVSFQNLNAGTYILALLDDKGHRVTEKIVVSK